MVSVSLWKEGVILTALKETVLQPLLKRSSLDPEVLENYHQVSNSHQGESARKT